MTNLHLWLQGVRYLIQKEFRQVFRDPAMLRIIFVAPIVQLLILSYAATTDVRNIRMVILDDDHTARSRELSRSFFTSETFVEVLPADNSADLMERLMRGNADIAVWIPRNYADDIAAGRTAVVSITVDGQNSSTAARAGGYAETVIRMQGAKVLENLSLQRPAFRQREHTVASISRFFYNPELESRYYMVPAILVILLTLVSGMLTGMAVVREKEIGTLEQLMVTPLTPGQIIAGKVIPFTILALFELGFAGSIAVIWFNVPFIGSVPLLFGCALAYLLVTLGVGLLASEVSSSQQQAMLTVMFYLMFGIMTSGFFYPVENMPRLIYLMTYANPMRYFIAIMRGIFLKGVTPYDVLPNLLPLIGIGIFVFTLAVLRFRRRME
jgi:ABC-2 type transport system permease protein